MGGVAAQLVKDRCLAALKDTRIGCLSSDKFDVFSEHLRFFQAQPFARHVLAPAGRKMMRADFGKGLWENLQEEEFGGGFDECLQAAEAAFPAAKVDLARIRAYLKALAADAGDFFAYLKASL